jgi:hypothetical protein
MVKQGSGHAVSTSPGAGPGADAQRSVLHCQVRGRGALPLAAHGGRRPRGAGQRGLPGYVRTPIFDTAVAVGLPRELVSRPPGRIKVMDAAQLILRGVARNQAVIAFPATSAGLGERPACFPAFSTAPLRRSCWSCERLARWQTRHRGRPICPSTNSPFRTHGVMGCVAPANRTPVFRPEISPEQHDSLQELVSPIAEVIGTASSAKHDALAVLGIDYALDYTREPFETTVRDADLVVDLVGGEVPFRSLEVLRPDGLLVYVPSDVLPDGLASAAAANSVRATAFVAEPDRTALEQLAVLATVGTLQVLLQDRFPLDAAADAHDFRCLRTNPPLRQDHPHSVTPHTSRCQRPRPRGRPPPRSPPCSSGPGATTSPGRPPPSGPRCDRRGWLSRRR